MLNKEFLEAVVNEALRLDPGERVFSTQGYDESVAVVQNARHIDWPAVILEDRSGGTLTLLDGGHDSHTQSVWILNAVATGEDPSMAYARSFAQMRRLVAALAVKAHRGEALLAGLMLVEFPYYKRRAAGCAGYEVMFYFEEDLDMTYDG